MTSREIFIARISLEQSKVKGNLEKAKEHFENALTSLEGINDIALVGKIEINLAIINSMQSNYNDAISYLSWSAHTYVW